MAILLDGTLGGTISGNLTFSSTGNRITGDFSNATVANRAIFQTSTTNGGTAVTAIPNGTSPVAAYVAINNSDPTNRSYIDMLATSTYNGFRSAYFGTGTYLPMTFQVGGSERVRITTNGGVSFGSSGTAYGSSGQVLSSNGDAAPSWITLNSGFTSMQIYDTAGSGTWTIPAGITQCKITVVGGGGAGGSGDSNTTTGGAGGGGGGGGTSIRYYTGLTPGNTISYTVGGAGGTSSVSSGTQTITTISATGGANGSNGTNLGASGGSGGVGSGGNINTEGGDGASGFGSTAGAIGGTGGVSMFGGNGYGRSNNTGIAGNLYGGGGGGGSSTSATARAGGAGTAGVVIIEY